MTGATQTVSADESTQGWILIKDGPVVVTSIWSFDIMSVGASEKDGSTQISMREANGLWHKTSATVADTHRAVSAARALWVGSSHNTAKRRSA